MLQEFKQGRRYVAQFKILNCIYVSRLQAKSEPTFA
jgi:hypothetical protein